MVNKITFFGFRGAIAPIAPPMDPPLFSGGFPSDVRWSFWRGVHWWFSRQHKVVIFTWFALLTFNLHYLQLKLLADYDYDDTTTRSMFVAKLPCNVKTENKGPVFFSEPRHRLKCRPFIHF